MLTCQWIHFNNLKCWILQLWSIPLQLMITLTPRKGIGQKPDSSYPVLWKLGSVKVFNELLRSWVGSSIHKLPRVFLLSGSACLCPAWVPSSLDPGPWATFPDWEQKSPAPSILGHWSPWSRTCPSISCIWLWLARDVTSRLSAGVDGGDAMAPGRPESSCGWAGPEQGHLCAPHPPCPRLRRTEWCRRALPGAQSREAGALLFAGSQRLRLAKMDGWPREGALRALPGAGWLPPLLLLAVLSTPSRGERVLGASKTTARCAHEVPGPNFLLKSLDSGVQVSRHIC